MPYESFTPEQQVAIASVVQDAATGAWMYVLHVQRGQGRSPRGPAAEDGFSHAYVVSRRFSEFKALHAALQPVMGSALPALPADGLMTLLLADSAELLAERRLALEQWLSTVLSHAAARDLPEVLDFLGHASISAKVLPSLQGQCASGSIRKTQNTTWAASLTGATAVSSA